MKFDFAGYIYRVKPCWKVGTSVIGSVRVENGPSPGLRENFAKSIFVLHFNNTIRYPCTTIQHRQWLRQNTWLTNSLRLSDVSRGYASVNLPCIIGSDNSLSPGRDKAVTWTNAGKLSIEPFGTNFSEPLIEIHIFSTKKTHLKVSSAKCRPFCLGLNLSIMN